MKSKTYFQAPEDYFWHWYDNGTQIIWMNGETVGTRDELIEILVALSNKGLPPLSPFVMLLPACKKEVHIQEKFFLLRSVFKLKEPVLERYDNKIKLLREVLIKEGGYLKRNHWRQSMN